MALRPGNEEEVPLANAFRSVEHAHHQFQSEYLTTGTIASGKIRNASSHPGTFRKSSSLLHA
jgi:hypothetical protein